MNQVSICVSIIVWCEALVRWFPWLLAHATANLGKAVQLMTAARWQMIGGTETFNESGFHWREHHSLVRSADKVVYLAARSTWVRRQIWDGRSNS